VKREWRELLPQQQAGIRCHEILFAFFLEEEFFKEWDKSKCVAAECIRLICGVGSRSELETNHKARVLWHQLDEKYQAWKMVDQI
jgi:hypothetical protein